MSKLLVGEKPTTITVIIDPELRTRLARAAAAHDRSLGGEVRVALREWLGETPAASASAGDTDIGSPLPMSEGHL